MRLNRRLLLMLSCLFFVLQCSTSDDSIEEPEPENTEEEIPITDPPQIEGPDPADGLASLETIEITMISATSATTGGSISDDGGAAIIGRGVCWGVQEEPTVDDDFTENGQGTGEYSAVLENLEPNTTYYVRAYAANSEGIAYGNELSFTTEEITEKVYEGDLTLRTNAEIEDFNIQGYTLINGSLTIHGITSDEFASLEGLQNLTAVSGGLNIWSNNGLQTLTGLDSLRMIGGHLNINTNDNLTSLDGLDALEQLGSIVIQYSPALANIESLAQITELESQLNINNCPSLTSLMGLHNITAIQGAVFIQYNDLLEDLNGLINLIEVGGSLNVTNNPELKNLTGLSELMTVEDAFIIERNHSLTAINSLNKLETAGALSITINDLLVEINGFTSLTEVRAFVAISQNDNLLNINGLNSLSTIEGSLYLEDNDSMINLTGLAALVSVGGTLDIERNLNLLSIDAFENLQSIGNGLYIQSNTFLTTISGFDSLSNLPFFRITNNSSLTDLCGLVSVVNDSGITDFNPAGNAYNPTISDLQMGNCSL